MILDSFLMVTSSRAFGALGSFTTVCSSFFLLTPQAFCNQLSWNKTTVQPLPLQWLQRSPSDAQVRPLSWQTVTRLDIVAGNGSTQQSLSSTTGVDPALPLYPAPPLDSSTPNAASPELAKSVQKNPWIIGFGGGAEFEPDPILPVVYARIGRFVSRNASISLRPRYIFGTTDLKGQKNSEGVFQLPLTLDLQFSRWLNPYLGGGISTNTNTTGRTNGMVSLGADIRLARNIALDLSLNYIIEPNVNDSNGGDLELTTVLYYRF